MRKKKEGKMIEKKPFKALVVDDEKIIRDFLVRLLDLEGTLSLAVESGTEAIEAAKREKFDVVFLDIRMPVMNGVETLKELKKIMPLGRFVLMTGYSVDQLLKDVDGESVEAIIRKPFDIQEILAVLEDYAAQRSTTQVLNILVVEEKKNISRFFEVLLRDCNCTVVGTSQEALEQVRNKKFDMVLSEIALKDMSGALLYSKIKEIQPALEIILFTTDAKKTRGFLYNQLKYLLR
jgi:two-component system, NtrC family, response regulator HydG